MPHCSWKLPVLPVRFWLVIFRIAWFCGYSRNTESSSEAAMRANVAADRLIDMARVHDSVFVVGHGIMTTLIARRLLRAGWCGPKRPVNTYWGYLVYRSPT